MTINLGRIPYLNSEVFYQDSPLDLLEVRTHVPSALSYAARRGEIDLAPVPIVTCFELENLFVPLGDFGVISDTCVYPSSRVSSRVPFCTGRAMGRWHQTGGEPLTTYPPELFAGLRRFFLNLDRYARVPSSQVFDVVSLPDSLVGFLEQQDFPARHREIRANTAGARNFRNRMLRWFNAFRLMKYIRQASDAHGGGPRVVDAARTLLEWLGDDCAPPADTRELLERYRRRDRLNAWPGQIQA